MSDTLTKLEPSKAGSREDDTPLSLGSRLCTSCGLCCMGVLHGSAVLEEDEIAAARALGLPVLDSERPAFALPCPRLEGTRCGVYPDRPRVCGRYKCQLLLDLESEVRDLPQSLIRVQEAKDLLQQVRASLPEGVSYGQARLAQGQGEASANNLLILALELFLDRHFRNERDKKSFETGSTPGVMEFDLDKQTFSRSDDSLFAEVGNDVVALNIPSGRCHGMEDVAAEVWRILEKPASLDEICGRLVQTYEVDPDECRTDVSGLLQTMISEGLVRVN